MVLVTHLSMATAAVDEDEKLVVVLVVLVVAVDDDVHELGAAIVSVVDGT